MLPVFISLSSAVPTSKLAPMISLKRLKYYLFLSLLFMVAFRKISVLSFDWGQLVLFDIYDSQGHRSVFVNKGVGDEW